MMTRAEYKPTEGKVLDLDVSSLIILSFYIVMSKRVYVYS